jgi:hypothetical protein
MHSRYRAGGGRIWEVLSIGTIVAALAGGVLFYTSFSGDEVFNPLIATESNPYTIFSVQHIVDLVNVLLLVAPLQIVWLIYLTVRTRRSQQSLDTPYSWIPSSAR